MTKAGRWLRVSSTHQDEASQEPDVDRWIAQRGYEVTETYRVHGYSAYHGEHEPDVRRMMADMASGKIEVLVVWKSDRLERRGAYALMGLIAESAKAGGRIEFVTEPALNNASDPIAGPMLQAFYGAMGHHESKTKSDRTSIKQAALRAAGSFAVGAEPYGYDIVTLDDGRKTLKPNDAAPVVQRIFKEVASGRTFFEVAKGLTADGIPTYSGNAVWSEGSIKHIIRRTAYRGHIQYKGSTYMEVEPLVSAADWLNANEGVRSRLRGGGISKTGRPLQALLRPVCGRCGSPLYRYKLHYRCSGQGPQAKGCGNTIRMETLDAEVTAEFLADDEPYFEDILISGSDHAEEIATVELALKDLNRRDPEYRAKRDALDAEFDRLMALPSQAPRVERVRDDFKTEGDAFREMTPGERRAHLRQWKVTVYPKDSENENALVAALHGRRWMLFWRG